MRPRAIGRVHCVHHVWIPARRGPPRRTRYKCTRKSSRHEWCERARAATSGASAGRHDRCTRYKCTRKSSRHEWCERARAATSGASAGRHERCERRDDRPRVSLHVGEAGDGESDADGCGILGAAARAGQSHLHVVCDAGLCCVQGAPQSARARSRAVRLAGACHAARRASAPGPDSASDGHRHWPPGMAGAALSRLPLDLAAGPLARRGSSVMSAAADTDSLRFREASRT